MPLRSPCNYLLALVPPANGFSVPHSGQRTGSPWLQSVSKGWPSQKNA